MSIGTEVCDSPFAGRDSHQPIEQKPCKLAQPKPEEVADAIRLKREMFGTCNAQAFCAMGGLTFTETMKVIDILSGGKP